MTTPIKIKSIKSIQKINEIVTRHPYEIWIHATSGTADAKSILGMFVLKLDEPLLLVTPDEIDPSRLYKELKEYIEFPDDVAETK
jgi:hypothetical protein